MDTALRAPVRPGSGSGPASGRVLEALSRLLPALPRDFAVELWTGERLEPEPDGPRFTLRLRHPGALRRMLWPPGELSLAEAFVRGDFDVQGDLVAAFALRERLAPRLATLAEVLRLPGSSPDRGGLAARAARPRGRLHSRRRDAQAVRHHYDLGNDFFAPWLDRRMVYSCAFFPTPAASLDDAQEAKLELICRKLRLAAGERLLDVGCGWGGLVIRAARCHGAEALGVTLSAPQADWARARIAELGLEGRCRVEVKDYRELGSERFDKVASVGMFEHVGARRLPEYFRQVHRLLRPGGAFLNHGIAALEPRPPWWRRRLLREGVFLGRYIFPDGEIPPFLATARAAAEAGFELRDVESLREHYALTLRAWLSRLEDRRDEAVRAAGEGTWRAWRLYLAGSAREFERGGIGVYQALYAKPDAGRSGLPLGRADWYRVPLPGAPSGAAP